MKIAHILLFLGGLLALAAAPTFASAQERKDAPKAKAKDNFVDYEALINEKLSRGVTPEKNALVLLWKAFGPSPDDGKTVPAAYFKRLGMEEPSKVGDYFVDLKTFLLKDAKLSQEEFGSVYWDHIEQARQYPWEAKDYPRIAAWLKVNEKPLELAVEASKRPAYYSPVISNKIEIVPAHPQFRDITMALLTRAMLSTFSGQHNAAWSDLLAAHRLARLVTRDGTLADTLMGISIEMKVIASELAYLECAKLDSKQILDHLKDLRGLPLLPVLADKIDSEVRLSQLQFIQDFRYNSGVVLSVLRSTLANDRELDRNLLLNRKGESRLDILGDIPEKLTAEEQKALDTMDWKPALKSANQWFDRIVAAMRENRVTSERELTAIFNELTDSIKGLPTGGIAKILLRGDAKEVVNTFGVILNSQFIPPVIRVSKAGHDLAVQNERNLHLAFALAAYKVDQGKYPAQLADLSPKYLAAVPDDLFSGKHLIYKPSDKGYLLYSVGPNGKDDDGHDAADSPPGDDLRVKMPLPAVKK